MAYENPQAFSFESKQLVNTEQFESTCRLDVASDKPIKKIVSVDALPKIVSSEKVAESLNFSGRTSYQVVYESEEGALSSVVAYIEWQDKIADFAYDNFYLCPKIQENTVTGFSANEVAISSLINVEVYSVVSEKISSVVGLTDDYVTEERNYECNRALNTVSESFNEVAEQEINSKVDEVLYSTGAVRLTQVTAGIDTITLEGDVYVIVYTLENGTVTAINKTIDFKQEIAALSTVPNNLVEAIVNLAELKVTATVSDIDQKTNLIYSIELSANATIYSRETINVVEDTFSVKKVINSNHECLVKTTFEGAGTYSETISGGFEADKEIDEISLITSATAEVSDIYQSEQGATLSGAINVSVLGINENKENVRVEGVIPFTITVNDASKTDLFDIKVKINNSKLRGQKDIELIAELFVTYKKYNKEFVSFVSSLEETEDKTASDSAIRVYIVKEGENLFNVAKTISVRPQDILAQNPSLDGEVTEGTRLVIYSPLDINF